MKGSLKVSSFLCRNIIWLSWNLSLHGEPSKGKLKCGFAWTNNLIKLSPGEDKEQTEKKKDLLYYLNHIIGRGYIILLSLFYVNCDSSFLENQLRLFQSPTINYIWCHFQPQLATPNEASLSVYKKINVCFSFLIWLLILGLYKN